MAHSRKRADIGWRTDQDRLDYLHAAMLCRYHHNLFELGKTHEEMYNLITDVIDNRPGGAFK